MYISDSVSINGSSSGMEDLTPTLVLTFILLGMCSGAYGVLIGSGGGFIVAPLLMIIFHMDHNMAVGTSLVTVSLASLSGSIAYFRLRRVDMRSAVLFSIAAIPGTILGILGLKMVTGPSFQIIFGCFLSIIGVFILFKPNDTKSTYQSSDNQPHIFQDTLTTRSRFFGTIRRKIITHDDTSYEYSYNQSFAIMTNGMFGFVSGFLGMGGGPLRTPTLVYLFNFPVYVATATSVVAQAIYTSVGTIGHIIDQNVDLVTACLVGIGMIAGAQIGARLSQRLQSTWILRLLGLSLLTISSQLILSGIRGT